MSQTNSIRIFRKDQRAILPTRKSARALGYDLHCLTEFSLAPGEIKAIDTGLVIEPPDGHAIEIRARSGLAKMGILLMNGVGTIDPDYCGPEDTIQILLGRFPDAYLYALQGALPPSYSATELPTGHLSFPAGSRIAQFVLVKLWNPGMPTEEVMAPTATSRGGLGSTGLTCPTAGDPVHQHQDQLWYFCDETWGCQGTGYTTRQFALDAVKAYARGL